MTPEYRFFLQLGEDGEKYPVTPVFKDDLSLDYEKETDEEFFRAKLSGKLDFIRSDCDLILKAAFDTVYYLHIEKSSDSGLTFEDYYKGKFMRTDCTVDEGNRIVSVQPDLADEYNDVLAGMEKEYDLIQLKPAIERLTITKRPLLQMYVPGDSVVSCYLSGMSWEQDAETVDDQNALENTYKFGLSGILKEIRIEPDTDGSLAGTAGLYLGNMSFSSQSPSRKDYKGNLENVEADSGEYYMRMEVKPTTNSALLAVSVELLRKSDNTLLYKYETGAWNGDNFDTAVFTMRAVEGAASGSLTAGMKGYNVYARLLLNVEAIDGISTSELPADDLVENNRNYRRAIKYGSTDLAYISGRYSEEPTEYGKADNGKYFLPPLSLSGRIFYPIARSTWREASLWFSPDYYFDGFYEEKGRQTYTLRDTFPVSSAISVLLGQFAPGVAHEATPEYSEFLYGDNPFIDGDLTLLVSPKSNLLEGDYQSPAQKAPATLKQFTDMLRDCFHCYWFVKDGKFRIEHIRWFRNGGSYSGTAAVGTNLLRLQNTRNGKTWAFGASEYSFDKVDMPERYECAWMDDVTEAFEGIPIEVVSKYVKEGKIEKVEVSNFTSDVDYMLLNPGEVSKDGFALFYAAGTPGSYELPFVAYKAGNKDFSMQNGYLAMRVLQPLFWVYDLPARRVRINGVERTAEGTTRNKKQEITFPVGGNDPDPMKLVKTVLGNGQIDKISVNLCSRMAKCTLRYDTEQQ